MGSPYLNSGENIVLTTHRVIADAVPYEIMLTTERIFLIDNRNVRFEPRIIPLSVIMSVQGGKTPAHDPVITLMFRTGDEGGTRQPLNLVFSQNMNENRKPERDNWVRNLIQLSINLHEKETFPEPSLVPEDTAAETGLRPTVRHGVAHEKVRPLSNVVDRQIAPVPVTVIPDEVDSSGEIPVPAPASSPVRVEKTTPEIVPEEPAADNIPLPETPSPAPVPPARVIIPQIIEELLPARNRAAPPAEQEPAPVEVIDHDSLHDSIQAVIQSLTVKEEQPPEPPGAQETVAMPETIPVSETSPEPSAAVPHPEATETTEVPEIIRALHTGATEPDTTENPDAETKGFAPEQVPENPQADIVTIPGSYSTLSIPEPVMEESEGHPPPEEVFTREPGAAEVPPLRHPIPPAREIRPLRRTLAYGAVLLIVIALAAAGALLVFSQGSPGQTFIPVSPTPTIAEVATLPPGTVQTTPPLPPSPVPPAATVVTTPVPTLPASSVPQDGVWVRINSTAGYIADLGNTERMQRVSGTGDRFYKIIRSDRPVQVIAQKQDNSGALLTIAIYRNGTLIGTRSVTSPMGAVDLLIDPLTARPPGLMENDTLPEHASPPTGLENY